MIMSGKTENNLFFKKTNMNIIKCYYCENTNNNKISLKLLNGLSIDKTDNTEKIYDRITDKFKEINIYKQKYKYLCNECMSYPRCYNSHNCRKCGGLIKYEQCKSILCTRLNNVSCISKCNKCNIDVEIIIHPNAYVYIINDRKPNCSMCGILYKTNYILEL